MFWRNVLPPSSGVHISQKEARKWGCQQDNKRSKPLKRVGPRIREENRRKKCCKYNIQGENGWYMVVCPENGSSRFLHNMGG
jgi:hypothetical protein